MAGPSTPVPQKDVRMDICGAVRLQIMSRTRNILSVQTILVSAPGEPTVVMKNPLYLPAVKLLIVRLHLKHHF
jgi:hypothetical protein